MLDLLDKYKIDILYSDSQCQSCISLIFTSAGICLFEKVSFSIELSISCTQIYNNNIGHHVVSFQQVAFISACSTNFTSIMR